MTARIVRGYARIGADPDHVEYLASLEGAKLLAHVEALLDAQGANTGAYDRYMAGLSQVTFSHFYGKAVPVKSRPGAWSEPETPAEPGVEGFQDALERIRSEILAVDSLYAGAWS